MSWLLNACRNNGELSFEAIHLDGRLEHISSKEFCKNKPITIGKKNQLRYYGDLENWSPTSENSHLKYFGIKAPEEHLNKQTIYSKLLDDGTTIFVPAQLLILALFKPNNALIPAIYSPAGIDLFGFIDYGAEAPKAVLELNKLNYVPQREKNGCFEALRWAHSSISARKSSISVYQNSLSGAIDLQLPKGEFRIVFSGEKVNNDFYASNANVISIAICGSDSISGAPMNFDIHSMISKTRKIPSIDLLPAILTTQNEFITVSDCEWINIQAQLLPPKRKRISVHCQRTLFNVILLKISKKVSWKAICRETKLDFTILTMTYRRWQLEGRLLRAISLLNSIRTSNMTKNNI